MQSNSFSRLNLFAPSSRLDALLVSATPAFDDEEHRDRDGKQDARDESFDNSNASAMSCKSCQWTNTGADRQEQVEHFKSSWHHHNLRRKLKEKVPLTEEEFDDLSSEHSESSDSTSSESEIDSAGQSDLRVYQKQSSHFFFKTADHQMFSIYKTLLGSSKRQENVDWMDELRQLPNKSHWVIILLSGGRFAGACFNGSEAEVHKTFQRYTVRAKQGGAQGIRDGQQHQRAPRSAGAALRRYNETALANEIQTLLRDWKPRLDSADLIFLRCSTYHQAIFYEDVFQKDDTRIRSLPFPIRRPTFDEVKRIHRRLSSIQCHGALEGFVKELKIVKKDRSSVMAISKTSSKVRQCPESLPDSPKKSNSPKLPKERQKVSETNKVDLAENKDLECPVLDKDAQQKIYTAFRLGDTEEFVSVCREQDGLKLIHYLNESRNVAGDTFLHLAAKDGRQALLRSLLELGADPCVKNKQNLVPFQVCKDRSARNVLSSFRLEFPMRWEWNLAQVPEPPSAEVEAERQRKEAEKRKAAKARKKEREQEKRATESEQRREEEERARFLALSDREKRALAAERRLQSPVRCFLCGQDIPSVPFHYNENRFCSTTCVKEHRKRTNPGP